MNTALHQEIENDLLRAKKALESAHRNIDANDHFTAANRTFVAAENVAYIILKSTFGSSSVSRKKILTHLGQKNSEAKGIYDEAYDLRVQADYGRSSSGHPLTKENVLQVLERVEALIAELSKR